jgi:TonB family protein
LKFQISNIGLFAFLFLNFVSATAAQRLAILTPDKAESSRLFADSLTEKTSLRVLDSDLSEAAFRSVSISNPFNLTRDEAKQIGAAIGCDYFIVTRSATQRRSSFQRKEYYEAFAAMHVFSARSGRMVLWQLPRFEAAKADAAAKALDISIQSIATEIDVAIRKANKTEIDEPQLPAMEEPPDAASPLAKGFRAPIPFRRIKPEYTEIAALFDVAATVEITVDLDAAGTILRTEITRSAGFGLDEAVEKAVRTMNWLSASRDGKPLAMRFLLRYNFKKVDKN